MVWKAPLPILGVLVPLVVLEEEEEDFFGLPAMSPVCVI
jgi:hypothetical protein